MDAGEERAQCAERTFVRVAHAKIVCRNTICIERLNDKTGRICIDLYHVDLPLHIQYKIKAREPCGKMKGIRQMQIGQKLRGHVHRTRKIGGRMLKDRRRLAKDAKERGRRRAQFVIEALRKCLCCVRRIAVRIIAVLDI